MASTLDRGTIVKEISAIFAEHGVECELAPEDLSIGEKCVGDFTKTHPRISDQIYTAVFPKAPSGVYSHYTTYGSFKSIFRTGTLRLYNLHKRFGSGEFRTFCRDHNLTGYLRTEGPDQEAGLYQDLMDDLFYISVVDQQQPNEEVLWRRFGSNGKGVRLNLEISADDHFDFRKVFYQKGVQIPLLQSLRTHFEQKYGVDFVPSRISRMGGFYQRDDYADQLEYRLLVKKHSDDYGFPFVPKHESPQRSRVQYIEVDLIQPIDASFQIEVVGVAAGPLLDQSMVQRYITTYAVLKSVPVLPR